MRLTADPRLHTVGYADLLVKIRELSPIDADSKFYDLHISDCEVVLRRHVNLSLGRDHSVTKVELTQPAMLRQVGRSDPEGP